MDDFGLDEKFQMESGKGFSTSTHIDGFVTVEHYEGPEKLFTADNGTTFTFKQLCKMKKEEIAFYFRKIGQGIEHRAENMEAGFVQWFGLWIRPANLATLVNKSNLVTTNGRNTTADLYLSSPSLNKPTGIIVGTSTQAAALADDDVVSAASATPFNSFDTSPAYPTRSANVTTFKSSWAAGEATGALTEAALKSGAATSDAISRIVFSAVNKGANDTLSVQFEWTFSS